MKILKNVVLYLVVLVMAFLFANPLGKLFFASNYQISFSSFIVSEYWYYFFDWIFLSYSFFLFFIFTTFSSGKGKYWWMGVLVLPALAFEVYFDLSHIYFPIALGLLGWLIGLGIQRLIAKLKTK